MPEPSKEQIEELVGRIRSSYDFDRLACIGVPFSRNLSVALPQVDSRSLKLQYVGYPIFIRKWFEYLNSPFDPSSEECETLISRISDRRSANMITYVCRMHLREETPVSWRKVAERGYDSRNASFPKTISEKLKSTGEAFTRLGVFEIDTSFRIVGGLPEVSRYYISAGSTLIAFERHIWRELRTKQLIQFSREHLEDATDEYSG